jgi:hypothetical protein
MKELITVVALSLVALIAARHFAPYDATDAAPVRSGLHLYIDHGTGCQYIGTLFSQPVPRLDANGKHVCK